MTVFEIALISCTFSIENNDDSMKENSTASPVPRTREPLSESIHLSCRDGMFTIYLYSGVRPVLKFKNDLDSLFVLNLPQ